MTILSLTGKQGNTLSNLQNNIISESEKDKLLFELRNKQVKQVCEIYLLQTKKLIAGIHSNKPSKHNTKVNKY